MSKTLPIQDRFSRNLRNGLAAKGITQRELARRVGLHFVTVNRIFQGRQTPPLDTIERLAKTCGIPLEKIFS